RRARHVDAGRHQHGHPPRGAARDGGAQRADRPMTNPEHASRKEHAPRGEIVRRVEAEAIVPVIRAATPELALRAARAILAGGISVFEITMTIPDATEVIRA